MAISCNVMEEIGASGKLTVNIVNWNNRGDVVDIREWYTDDEGTTKPGKGITIKSKQLDTMIDLLTKAKEYFKEEE